MSRHPAKFTQADIRRAMAAATKVGPNIAVEILPDGRIRMTQDGAPKPESQQDGPNPWDT